MPKKTTHLGGLFYLVMHRLFLGMFLPCLIQDFAIGHQHAVGHGRTCLGFDLGACQESTHCVHGQHLGPLLLGEVILTVGLIEFVVGPHHALHEPDQVPEDLHTADAVEILGRQVFLLQGVGQLGAELIDGGIGVLGVGGDGGEVIGANLCLGFQNGLKILLTAQITADQIADAHADGHRPVAVAELTVVIHLEPGTHGVIPDGEGIDDGIGGLNLVAQVIVEPVGVDAFARNGAIEASQTAAPEGVFPDVDDSGFPGHFRPESIDHDLQLGIIIPEVCHDDHIAGLFHRVRFRNGDGLGGSWDRGSREGLINIFRHGPAEVTEEIFGLLLAFFRGQIVHIRRKTPDIP